MNEMGLYLLTTFGITGFFLWLIADLLVFHQERGEKMAAWIAGLFAWSSKRVEKIATAMSVQGKVDSFVESVDSEVRGLLPYGLKIKWVAPGVDRQAFIKKGNVVVMLSHHKNQDENLSRATTLYMNKAVIPEARPHIDNKLAKAIDVMMTKKALYSFAESRSALDHFVSNVLQPQTASDADLKEFCEDIEVTDERGLFTRILLRELLELGRRRAGHTETGDSVFESNQFVKHLKTIAEKEKGEDVNPDFLRSDIRVSIIFIARSEKIEKGAEQYLAAINRFGIQKSSRVIYVFSRGNKNIDFAKDVVRHAGERFGALNKVHEEEYATRGEYGTPVQVYCAIFYNRKAI